MKFMDELEKLNRVLSELNENLEAVTEKCRVAKLMGLTVDELEAELAGGARIKAAAKVAAKEELEGPADV